MQVSDLEAAKAALESSLASIEEQSRVAASRAAISEAQLVQLEGLEQDLKAQLQSALASQETASQDCTTARERAAGLAAEVEAKDCRLRSVARASVMWGNVHT